MKELIYALVITAFFYGCEESVKDGGIVAPVESPKFTITDFYAPDTVIYSQNDSSFVINVVLDSNSKFDGAWLRLFSPNGEAINKQPVYLRDNGRLVDGDSVEGDGKYSAKLYLSRYNSNGTYELVIYANFALYGNNKVLTHKFKYFNEQINYPPVLYNLSMPDTIEIETPFAFTVQAYDQNGPEDIKKVSFKFIRLEDGTESDFYQMTKSDDVYRFENIFSSAAKGKTRKFIFQAEDQSGALSDSLTHYIYVK